MIPPLPARATPVRRILCAFPRASWPRYIPQAMPEITRQEMLGEGISLPVFGPNFANCRGEQYMHDFNLSSTGDEFLSLFRNPRGLA